MQWMMADTGRKVLADVEEERRVLTVMTSVVARVGPMLPT